MENPVDPCTGKVTSNTCNQYWHVFDFDSTTNEFTLGNKMIDRAR